MKPRDGDYLWVGEGTPDPLVRRLEEQLAGLRHPPDPPDWERAPSSPAGSVAARREWRRAWVLAAAAGLLLVLGAVRWWVAPLDGGGWRAERLAGAPRLGGDPLSRARELRAGATIVTGAADRARLRLAGVGEVEVGPHSRVRLLAARAGEQVLALDRGVLHASIVARPQLFQVATPRARAVDLGCHFTLEVLADGRERLLVETGWVALRRGEREAFVPGGAAVVSWPGELGLPVYLEVPELRLAVDRWTALPAGEARRRALAKVVALARPRDALTLWHLLAAGDESERREVFAALANVAPPPAGVTVDGIAAGDAAMRDRWWQSLGLGTARWWRGWRVTYPAVPGGAPLPSPPG
ncbi:MAG TPA: FecR domain-containing protein [Thermoanaerobaculia bacterium]|jgi:hypothetical protein|nr:FecR domain-containing protein [Thermoanaerobaculia bacterium]